MEAIRDGWGEPVKLVCGEPPDDGEPLMVWGQRLLAETLIPKAIAAGRAWWQIDNGFWDASDYRQQGHYRVTYRSLSPVLLDPAPMDRPDLPTLAPWRENGRYVLFAHPGDGFGVALGLDMTEWIWRAWDGLRRQTKRPLMIRPKICRRPLATDLCGAWALVTHSSNVAVDAVLAGVPVFVEATSPAAPVARIGLSGIERPALLDRGPWLRSLACQQFTLDEMRDGTAFRCLTAVREFVERA